MIYDSYCLGLPLNLSRLLSKKLKSPHEIRYLHILTKGCSELKSCSRSLLRTGQKKLIKRNKTSLTHASKQLKGYLNQSDFVVIEVQRGSKQNSNAVQKSAVSETSSVFTTGLFYPLSSFQIATDRTSCEMMTS